MFLLNLKFFIVIVTLQCAAYVNCKNDTSRNGKTYFLQLKNVGDGELSYKPIWTKHIRSKNSKSPEEYEILGRLIQNEDITKEEDDDNSIEVIDDNWNKYGKVSIAEYPDKISEFYAAFQSNEANKINNSTELRFLFEVDATDNEIFRFDVNDLDLENDTIIDAELYIYRHQNEKNKLKENSNFNYVARLYQVTENITNPEITKHKPDVHRLLNVVYVPSVDDGWQIFKVNTAIKNWLNGDENLGFFVTFKDNADNLVNVNFAHKNTSDDQYQPFIVFYVKDQKHNKNISSVKDSGNFKINSKGLKLLQYGEVPCSRYIWYVNFHHLGWDHFILEPKGYMAYKCKGSCKSHFSADFSNYGKILSLYKRKNEEFSGPGCVPISFKPLLMMYLNNHNHIIIRYYEDMIVDKCGCR